MSSTSKKHSNFVSEPMRNRRVTDLPGIGETLGQRMSSAGYGKASNVYGQYLVMNGDRRQFQAWMRDTSGANSKQQSDCYNGLREWDYNNA